MSDLLVVSLGTTLGWRVADRLFCEQAEAAGASTEIVAVGRGAADRLRRGYPVNDFVEARRRGARFSRHWSASEPRAIAFSSSTTAMLGPETGLPYAVRLDAPAALNRPGRRSSPVRALERRVLSRARVVLPRATLREGLPAGAAPAVVLPPPVVSSGEHEGDEPLAVAYVPDPKAKGLDVVVKPGPGLRSAAPSWRSSRWSPTVARRRIVARPDAAVGATCGGRPARGVPRHAASRSRPRGGRALGGLRQAPLEALADGHCSPRFRRPASFAALPLARELARRLVSDDLAAAVTAAFALEDLTAYRARAADLVAPFRLEALVSRIRDEVPLPFG